MIMRLLTAHVRDGVIVLDDDVELSEGTPLTVLANEPMSGDPLSAREEEELLESIRAMEDAAVTGAEELLRRLE